MVKHVCGVSGIEFETKEQESPVLEILRLDRERRSLIYEREKVSPANRARFEEIQRKLADFESRFLPLSN